MSMRIGKTTDGRICKRVRLNSDGTTQLQPVKPNDTKTGWVNNGNQFTAGKGQFQPQFVDIN